jgi:hypothetical protein
MNEQVILLMFLAGVCLVVVGYTFFITHHPVLSLFGLVFLGWGGGLLGGVVFILLSEAQKQKVVECQTDEQTNEDERQ